MRCLDSANAINIKAPCTLQSTTQSKNFVLTLSVHRINNYKLKMFRVSYSSSREAFAIENIIDSLSPSSL